MIRSPAERGLLKAIAKEQLKEHDRLTKTYPDGIREGRIYIFQDGQHSARAAKWWEYRLTNEGRMALEEENE